MPRLNKRDSSRDICVCQCYKSQHRNDGPCEESQEEQWHTCKGFKQKSYAHLDIDAPRHRGHFMVAASMSKSAQDVLQFTRELLS